MNDVFISLNKWFKKPVNLHEVLRKQMSWNWIVYQQHNLYLSEKAETRKQKQLNSFPLKLTVTYIGKKIHWIYYPETKFIMVHCGGTGTSLMKTEILKLVFLTYLLPSCYMEQFSGKVQQTAKKYFVSKRKSLE
jgi:hypothetical protein